MQDRKLLKATYLPLDESKKASPARTARRHNLAVTLSKLKEVINNRKETSAKKLSGHLLPTSAITRLLSLNQMIKVKRSAQSFPNNSKNRIICPNATILTMATSWLTYKTLRWIQIKTLDSKILAVVRSKMTSSSLPIMICHAKSSKLPFQF